MAGDEFEKPIPFHSGHSPDSVADSSKGGSARRLRKICVSAIVVGLVFTALGGTPNRRSLPYLAGGLAALVLLTILAPRVSQRRSSTLRVSSKLALLATTLFLLILLGETGLHLFFSQDFRPIPPGLGYAYAKTLGWFPIPNDHRSLSITVINNTKGFRGAEFRKNDQPGIVFLGDSFVWGHGVEVTDRFTEKLQSSHPEWNIYNLGITGYGTDQEYLLLQRYFDELKPRLVFLVFCSENDREDNSLNARYNSFKPYYTVTAHGLKLNGVPVPRSEHLLCLEHPLLSKSYLFRLVVRTYKNMTLPVERSYSDPTTIILAEIQRYVKERQSILVVGLTATDPALERFLQDSNIPWVDLTTQHRFSEDYHWSPEGHTFVCARIEQFLLGGKYLSSSHAPAAGRP